MDLDDEFDESSYREDLELLSHGNNKALINVLSQVAEEHVNGQYAYRIKVKHWALLSPANSKIVEIFENKIVKVATIDKSSGKEVY